MIDVQRRGVLYAIGCSSGVEERGSSEARRGDQVDWRSAGRSVVKPFGGGAWMGGLGRRGSCPKAA